MYILNRKYHINSARKVEKETKGPLNPQSEIVVANLPFAFKARKAVTGQREKWKIIGTDGLRLRSKGN